MLLDESGLPTVPAGAATVGIPLTMFAMESLPFWRTLLAGCGLATTLSDPTNKRIVQAGLDTVVSEPCFPIIAAHGHVADLLDKNVDHVLVPNIVAARTQWTHTNSYLCPWHQTLPFMVRQAPALKGQASKLIMPTVDFRRSRKIVIKALHKSLSPLGISRARVAGAFDLALAAQERFETDFRKIGRGEVDKLIKSGRPGIVLVGRPYNVHDAGMNLSVVRKLRDYYGVNCIPYDCLDLDDVDVRDVNETMYWNLGRRILAAGRIVSHHENLHIIYITNFKCGPDSFIKHFVRSASGKPFLTLQFDGHSNDAGVMTRCEAYLDSKGILRQWRDDQVTSSAK